MDTADTLVAHGLRPTVVRQRIFALMVQETVEGRPVTPDEVLRRLTATGFMPSLPSVYRVLLELVRTGLVERFRPTPGTSVFALKQPRHQVHLMCRRCRAVEAVDDPRVHARLQAIGQVRGFAVERVGWSLSGVCRRCGPS